jgi:two-component sensor histidine kinase
VSNLEQPYFRQPVQCFAEGDGLVWNLVLRASAEESFFDLMSAWSENDERVESVEFKQYLHNLCEDLSGLLFQGETEYTIVVEAAKINIPTVFAIPLGFIVDELITNSAKYARSNITVRLETTPTIGNSLSVLDDGPGLPEGFDPAESKGLGMKIIGSLVKQIGGELEIAPGEDGHGARFTVKFGPPFAAEWSRHGI